MKSSQQQAHFVNIPIGQASRQASGVRKHPTVLKVIGDDDGGGVGVTRFMRL